mmetsp:Transcript_37655/g.82358  ORF Transcript_37655/g.82358 Transcript_37655/m.82358 type:complete len:361 (-) Transcript_37655:227-1309(-)
MRILHLVPQKLSKEVGHLVRILAPQASRLHKPLAQHAANKRVSAWAPALVLYKLLVLGHPPDCTRRTIDNNLSNSSTPMVTLKRKITSRLAVASINHHHREVPVQDKRRAIALRHVAHDHTPHALTLEVRDQCLRAGSRGAVSVHPSGAQGTRDLGRWASVVDKGGAAACCPRLTRVGGWGGCPGRGALPVGNLIRRPRIDADDPSGHISHILLPRNASQRPAIVLHQEMPVHKQSIIQEHGDLSIGKVITQISVGLHCLQVAVGHHVVGDGVGGGAIQYSKLLAPELEILRCPHPVLQHVLQPHSCVVVLLHGLLVHLSFGHVLRGSSNLTHVLGVALRVFRPVDWGDSQGFHLVGGEL